MYCAIWSSTIFVRNFYILCITRIMFGLSNSINDVADSTYISENSSPTIRGIVSSALLLTYFAAVFVEFSLATYLSYTNTAVANTFIAAGAFATLYFCTETPYFLIMKGQRERAEKNLTWLSGDSSRAEVVEELRRIEQSIAEEKEKKKSLRLLFSLPANLRGILLVVCSNITSTASGCGAIAPYASLIFAPTESLTSNEFTVMYGFVALISAPIMLFIIEKFDRRSLFIGCYVGAACCNLCSFLLMYLHYAGYQLPYYSWLISAPISVYGLVMTLQAPVGHALKGELLPFSVRAIGTSLRATGQSLATFCVAKMFIPISQNFGMQTNFLVYVLVSAVATVPYYYVLPETRGKTLHELQNMHKCEQDVDQGAREKLMP